MTKKIFGFRIEGFSGDIVIRTPFKLGISFQKPWWSLLVGLTYIEPCVEWNFLCFSGEIWIDREIEY